MAASVIALRPLFVLTLLAALSYPCFVSAANKPPSFEFNRLCQQQGLTSQPQWRKCAELTVTEWSRAIVDNAVRFSLPTATVLFAGIIDPNITLRVEPMGTFIGVAMVIEYSNVFANPTAAAQIIKPLSYHIRRFIVSRPIAVATVDYLYTNAVTGATTNLTFNQWFRFDNYSRVAAADFTIDRFAEFLPALGVQRVIGSNPNFPTLFKTIVCQAAVNYCRSPPLQQYADMQTCMDFLSSIPILDPRRVQSNSVLCRYWHSPLVGFAPEIHCPHIGPSGGDMCMDGPYSAFYTASPFPVDTFALP